MAKSKKTSDAFDMADDIRKEVAAESVADACSTSVPAIYSLAKGDNPRRAKYDKNADVIGYNLRLPANIHRLLKRHCMETNESMNNVVLVGFVSSEHMKRLYRWKLGIKPRHYSLSERVLLHDRRK